MRELRCAGRREDTQQGTLATMAGGDCIATTLMSVAHRLADRPGTEWLAARSKAPLHPGHLPKAQLPVEMPRPAAAADRVSRPS